MADVDGTYCDIISGFSDTDILNAKDGTYEILGLAPIQAPPSTTTVVVSNNPTLSHTALPFLGSDTTCLTDLPLIDLQITDPRVLIGQRIARRLTTPRGALASINDDPNAGFDVRQYVNAKMPPGAVIAAQSAISFECQKDEDVGSAVVEMTLAGGNLTITIQLGTAAGPFLLTLNVGDLTVDAVFTF